MSNKSSIYAMGDLHLGLFHGKNMDVFGGDWLNHTEKIREKWLSAVNPGDCVLLCGDISWAINHEELKPDTDFLQALPGEKILIKGNHDYWWGSTSYLNSSLDMKFLRNNYFSFGDYAICGTRGWICPWDEKFTPHDKKIYERELNRLRLSLDSAVSAGYERIITMLHYPPIAVSAEPETSDFQKSGFTEIVDNYPVEKVIFGHLHSVSRANGEYFKLINGIEYHLVSSVHLDFLPKKIV